ASANFSRDEADRWSAPATSVEAWDRSGASPLAPRLRTIGTTSRSLRCRGAQVVIMHSVVKTLYRSPNGDNWLLAQDATGALFVTHKPNPSSGGQTSTVTADEFLACSADVPER